MHEADFSRAQGRAMKITPDIKTLLGFSSSSVTGLSKVLNKRPQLIEVEKHIDDYKRGRGNLSQEVGSKIADIQTNSSLSLDPKSSKSYNSYITGFKYSSKARFVNDLDRTFESTQTIQNFYKKV